MLALQEEQSVAQSEVSVSGSIATEGSVTYILSSQVEQLNSVTAIGEQNNMTNTSAHTDLWLKLSK